MSFFPCLSFHCTRRFDPLMPFRAVPPAGCGESSARRSTETTASPFEPAGAAAGARDPAAGEGEARFLPLPLQDTLLKLRRSIAGWHQTPRPPTSIPPADSIQSVMQSTSPRISKHPADKTPKQNQIRTKSSHNPDTSTGKQKSNLIYRWGQWKSAGKKKQSCGSEETNRIRRKAERGPRGGIFRIEWAGGDARGGQANATRFFRDREEGGGFAAELVGEGRGGEVRRRIGKLESGGRRIRRRQAEGGNGKSARVLCDLLPR